MDGNHGGRDGGAMGRRGIAAAKAGPGGGPRIVCKAGASRGADCRAEQAEASSSRERRRKKDLAALSEVQAGGATEAEKSVEIRKFASEEAGLDHDHDLALSLHHDHEECYHSNLGKYRVESREYFEE